MGPCFEYKRSIVLSILKMVSVVDVVFEIPAKKESDLEKIIKTCDDVLTKIICQKSIKLMRRELRYLCSLMGKLEEEFMNSNKNLLVAGFIILRYFSPSFTDPSKYVGEMKEITPTVKTNLTFVTRVIQVNLFFYFVRLFLIIFFFKKIETFYFQKIQHKRI